MNELETQLSSWAPRRPSATVKARLFGEQPTANEPSFSLSWLAPAAVAVLLALAVFNPREISQGSGSRFSGPIAAVIMSNQSYAAYLPSSFQPEQNGLPKDTFEWTNGSGSTSSMHLLSPMKANDQD